MSKKLLALLLAALMTCSVFAGCSTTKEVIISGDSDTTTADDGADPDNPENPDDNSDDNNDNKDNNNSGKVSKKKTKKAKKTTAGKTTKARRNDKKGSETMKFTPAADKGANYSVKGTVRIAVDTVRPTDFQAMFDVMEDLYPNVTIKLDKWTHTSNDDGREYLIRTMKIGRAHV